MKRGKTGRKPIYASGYLLLMLCVIICTQGFFFSRVNAEASTGFDLTSIKATSVIVTDAERGQVLMSRNKDEKLHISAACKLMTILIALENGDISSNVTISKDSVDAEGSALSLEVGEKYSLEDLLYAIMLSSANDAAKAVAEYVSGDTASFVIKMNETAARLKMDNTHFTNPTGLYDEGQYTTASDISAMIRYAISNSTFEKMFSTNARPWIHKDGSTSILTSQNKLFWSFSGIEGGKTGYNQKELQSLITTAARNDLRLVCVVLDSPEESVFQDATALMEIGFSNFRKGILVKAEDKIDTVKIDGTPVNLIAAEDVYYVHPNGDSYIKDLTISTDSSVPFKKGKIAGTATYLLNDGTTIDIALYPENEIIQSEDFLTTAKDKITENKDILYLIYFLIIIEIFLFISNIIKLLVKLKKRLQKPQ